MKPRKKISIWTIFSIFVSIGAVLELTTNNYGRGDISYFWCYSIIFLDILSVTIYLGEKAYKKYKIRNEKEVD